MSRLPYFNQDVEDEGYPEPVEGLREKIRTHDAVLIAIPEYDYAVPGALTAALDWALRSRYDPTPFRHKPVGIVGASPGGGDCQGVDGFETDTPAPPAYVMPEPQMLIPFSRQKFDAETRDLVDEETRERLRGFSSTSATAFSERPVRLATSSAISRSSSGTPRRSPSGPPCLLACSLTSSSRERIDRGRVT